MVLSPLPVGWSHGVCDLAPLQHNHSDVFEPYAGRLPLNLTNLGIYSASGQVDKAFEEASFGRACLRSCQAHGACRHVSFSLSLQACLWFVACDPAEPAANLDWYTASLPTSLGCASSQALSRAYQLAIDGSTSTGSLGRVYLKQYSHHFNKLIQRDAAAGYHNEVASLCRIAAAKPACQSEQWPRIPFFPELVFRNDSLLITGTMIPTPPSDAPVWPQKNQVRCIWDTLASAGVLYRDLNCKQARVTRGGQMTLLDFEAAHVIGDTWSNFRKPDEEHYFTPFMYEQFEHVLLHCFPPASRPAPNHPGAFWDHGNWWEPTPDGGERKVLN